MPQRPWWCRRGTRTVLQAGSRTSQTSADTECSEGWKTLMYLDVSGSTMKRTCHWLFVAGVSPSPKVRVVGCFFVGAVVCACWPRVFWAGWRWLPGCRVDRKATSFLGISSFTTRRRHQDLLFRSLVKMTLDGWGQQDA